MTRVLVVGGTGFIGGHAAAHLARVGYDVTVTSRTPGDGRVALDYLQPDPRALEGYDSVVFAAGSDIRHVAVEDENAAFWAATQGNAVPAFAAASRDAGVGRFVQLGSYYHQVDPAFAEASAYVKGRKDADEGTRALTTDSFAAITLNPPSIVGTAPGAVQRRFARMVSWARGERQEPPLTAPPGGTNYLSVRSLSQAIAGALAVGEPGHAYLLGDENLSYREYFQLFADEAGGGITIEERDEEHPYQPDRFIVQGRGTVIAIEPDPDEVALLGYDRQDIRRAVREIVESVDAEPAAS